MITNERSPVAARKMTMRATLPPYSYSEDYCTRTTTTRPWLFFPSVEGTLSILDAVLLHVLLPLLSILGTHWTTEHDERRRKNRGKKPLKFHHCPASIIYHPSPSPFPSPFTHRPPPTPSPTPQLSKRPRTESDKKSSRPHITPRAPQESQSTSRISSSPWNRGKKAGAKPPVRHPYPNLPVSPSLRR